MDLKTLKSNLLKAAKAVSFTGANRTAVQKLWKFFQEQVSHKLYRKTLIDLAVVLKFPSGRKSKNREYVNFISEIVTVFCTSGKPTLYTLAKKTYNLRKPASGTSVKELLEHIHSKIINRLKKKADKTKTMKRAKRGGRPTRLITDVVVQGHLEDAADTIEAKMYAALADDKLAAGHAARFIFDVKYDFSMQELVKMVKTIVSSSFTAALRRFHFSAKLIVKGTIANTMSGELREGVEAHFPRAGARIIESKEDMKEALDDFVQEVRGHEEIEELYPSTKWKYDQVTAIGVKIFKRESGGCQGAKTIKCFINSCKNPDNTDNLCFWRCLAMALYRDGYKEILKKDSKMQRVKALELLALCRKLLKRKIPERVSLELVPDIADILGLNIEIRTIDENDEPELLCADPKLAGNPGASKLGLQREKPIMLHFDQDNKHYILIKTLMGYGKCIRCSTCKVKFYGKNRDRAWKTHKRKHLRETPFEPSEKVFIDGELRPKTTQFQRLIGMQARAPVFFAFDFEAMLVKDKMKDGNTTFMQRHEEIGVVCKLHCEGDVVPVPDFEYVGSDVAIQLVRYLEQSYPAVKAYKDKYLFRTYEKELKTLAVRLCDCKNNRLKHNGYCNKGYTNSPKNAKQKKCVCKFRKLHDKECKFVKQRKALLMEWSHVPVIGFNSGRYDMTFVMNAIAQITKEVPKVISKGSGYMSVRFGNYDFIDARNFVPPNVNLSKYASMFGVTDVKKELFPYDWFDCGEKLEEKQLPPKEVFYNRLRHTMPSDEEYQEALHIWDENDFRTFEEYMMFYCRCDVDLLIKATNNYRSLLWETSKLELLSFISLPQMAYCDMLTNYADKKKYPLRYIPNEPAFNIITDALYGGNTQVFIREECIQNEDELIFSLDENNLYGHSMSQLLPYGDFKHHRMDERCKEVLRSLKRVSKSIRLHRNYSHKVLHNKSDRVPKDPYDFTGFVRCHLYFTPAQKTRMQHFPPLPSRRAPKDDEMSDFMKQLRSEIEVKNGTTKSRSQKLVYDLEEKQAYSIYSEYLKFLLENDMISIEAVYEVVEMKVGYVLRPYIKKMTECRQKAEDDIRLGNKTGNEQLVIDGKARKAYYKLKANAVFGKTMQADERFTDTSFARNGTQFLKQVMGKVHVDSVIIDHNLVEVKTKKSKTRIRSPKYLGAAILANSKMLMLDYIYNCMWQSGSKYSPDNCKILYTDTDSIYVKCSGLTGETKKERFESYLDGLDSSLRELHHAGEGELTVGKMKLEQLIEEAVFLKPKTYALLCEKEGKQTKDDDLVEVSHNKGVIMYQNKEAHRFKVYKEVLEMCKSVKCKNTIIQKTTKFAGVTMNTLQVTKVGLDAWYDKRVLVDNKITEPYGLIKKPPKRSIEERMWNNMKTSVESLMELTEEVLGCDMDEFVQHIGKQFKVGMCWRNYGAIWNLDHIIPRAFATKPHEEFTKMKKRDQEKIKRAICHYTNMQPLTVSQNSSKKDHIDEETLKRVSDVVKR